MSATKSAWVTAFTATIIVTTILTVMGIVGMSIIFKVMADNIGRIDDRIDANRDALEAIEDNVDVVEDDVAYINETMAEGNGTVFFDDEWVMAHGLAPSQQFMFNAGLITSTHPPDRREYWLPDKDGVIALLSDIPGQSGDYSEDAFALFKAGEPLTRVVFDLSWIDSGEMRVFELPNQYGRIALFDDLHTLIYHPNQSVFLDSKFEIRHDADTSKRARFDASQLVGGHLYVLPDMDGTLVVTEGAQTITDKILTNNVTWFSSATGTAQFDLDALTTERFYTLTDQDQTLIGRDGLDWAPESMGWSPTNATYSQIRLGGAFQRDRFMQFAALGSGSGGDVGRGGVDFSWFDQDNYRMHTISVGGFALSYSETGIPSTNNDLGSPLFRIEPVSGIINFVDRNDGAKRARFDISKLATTETFEFQNQNGTLVVIEDHVSFNDASFAIFNDADNSKVMQVDASGIDSGNTRVYNLPNRNGNLFLRETKIGWLSESGRFAVSGSPAIEDGEAETLPWVPVFDPNGNLQFPKFWVAPQDGLYSVTAQVTWEGTGNGGLREVEIRQQRGGILDPNFFITIVARSETSSTPTPTPQPRTVSHASGSVRLKADDTISVYVNQFSGAFIFIEPGVENTFLAITYHGPM